MKCPHCGKRLWAAYPACPFCKTTLAAPASDASVAAEPVDVESWLTLAKCQTLSEADAIRAHLEGAGIAAFLPDEQLMQTIAWNFNTYGFVRVQVSSKDFEKATQALSLMGQQSNGDPAEPSVRVADLPLPWPMKWCAFVLPLFACVGLIIFLVAKGAYLRQGCERRETQLWQWFIAGFAFWVLFLIALAMITMFIAP